MTKNNSVLPGSEKWSDFYSKGIGAVYPTENLIRLIKGKYIDTPRDGRALDVGFGTGNNLIFLAHSGFEAHGLEVSQESIKMAQELAGHTRVKLNLSLLNGTKLPYADGFFDLVVSWNAVYYYGNRTLVREAIRDFHRVLRPGGVLLMSVTHPNSFMARRFSEDLGDGRHKIDRASPYDTRDGIDIFYDGTSSGWRKLLSDFKEVEEGFVEADLFVPDRRDAWRLFHARKEN